MTPFLGELAALGTSICWSATATFFTLAGQKVGSVVVNRIRLLLAVLFLLTAHWLLQGSLLPLSAGRERWSWLALSGVIGLVVADGFLFQSYVWIGPRLGSLLMSLSPVVSALLAWLVLAEKLTIGQMAGIALAISGVMWVVLDRDSPVRTSPDRRRYLWGVLFGLGAATGQAVGLITAKKGLGGDFPALSGNLIRMLAATATLWAITLFQGQAGATVQRLASERPAMVNIVGGAIFGPFLGVWLSLIAIQLTHIGVASTLMALPPIFLLPISHFVFKERLGWAAVVGTVAAMIGVVILFWV
ncbi:MAG: DMT family transporter [Anaerolineae bacterium]|nr:DMT family transporter [Anaerolineae bacterium]